MKWFDYVKATPMTQIFADLQEFAGLKRALIRAEKDMVKSGVPLVRHYGVDENIEMGNACIKSKHLIDDFELFEYSPCSYHVEYCPNFAPNGVERKCQHNLCAMWRDNNLYCGNKQKYNDLKTAYDRFWVNKFARVK